MFPKNKMPWKNKNKVNKATSKTNNRTYILKKNKLLKIYSKQFPQNVEKNIERKPMTEKYRHKFWEIHNLKDFYLCTTSFVLLLIWTINFIHDYFY